MKKLLCCFTIVLLMLYCVCLPALADTFQVSLSVDFDENLMFSRYDVDLFLDGQKIDTLRHGVNYSGQFEADEGSHVLWFYEHNDKSNSGSITFTVSGNTRISCKIHCRSYKVDVSDVEIERGEGGTPGNSSRSLEPEVQQEEPEVPSQPGDDQIGHSEEKTDTSILKSGNGVWLDFETATDEELQEGIDKIKAEQRARIKTKLVLDKTTITLGKGKTEKVAVEVIDLPEGIKAGKITAETSDKGVASVSGNTIKGVNAGTAVITFSCVLSDDTEITEECKVDVIVPAKSMTPKNKSIQLGVGDTTTAEFKIAPAEASTRLSYSTTDASVAAVTSKGEIRGVGIGTATITAKTTDGTGISASMTVKVTKSDDVGKTKITKGGVSVTLTRYKETTGSSFTKAEAGKTFVLVEFLIENNSSEEITISSLLSFDGYCDGYTCDYSLSATMNADQSLDGSIAPGKKMKGQIGYEVSTKWKEMEIHVKPDYWGGDDLSFTVCKQ